MISEESILQSTNDIILSLSVEYKEGNKLVFYFRETSKSIGSKTSRAKSSLLKEKDPCLSTKAWDMMETGAEGKNMEKEYCSITTEHLRFDN